MTEFLIQLAAALAAALAGVFLAWLDRRRSTPVVMKDVETPPELLDAWHRWLADRLRNREGKRD